MSTHSLAITYAGTDGSAASAWVRLEQAPVSSTLLTDTDLQIMLAMVRSGTSARAYKPASCEAYTQGSMVYADLDLYVWPSSLDLTYSLSAALLAVGAPATLRLEREFDLVVEMAAEIDLPFIAESLSATWQTPCYNARGEEVAAPGISVHPTSIRLDAEVFGVLRIKCVATGYRHSLSFAMPKTGAEIVTNLNPTATVSWGSGSDAQAATLDVALPACLEALLAACDDGQTYRDHTYGEIDEDEELVPYIYYSPCSGRMLAVRNERP